VLGSELIDRLTPLGYRNSKVGLIILRGESSIFKGTKTEGLASLILFETTTLFLFGLDWLAGLLIFFIQPSKVLG
jgi:hypothetical protein